MDQNLHSLFELAFTDYLYKDLTELYFKQISLACQQNLEFLLEPQVYQYSKACFDVYRLYPDRDFNKEVLFGHLELLKTCY